MRLRRIYESTNILDRLAVFRVTLWADPDLPKEELVGHFTRQFTSNPPPGIKRVDADVIRIDFDSEDENGLIQVYVRMTIEDYIRNSIEYDDDPYAILKEIKRAAGPEAAAAAYQFMRTATDLKVAKLSATKQPWESPGSGDIHADRWPTQVDL